MKLDLLTNATVVGDAIRFVASESEKSKDKDREQVKSSASTSSYSGCNEDNNKESKEPDYDYDDEKSDKVGEEKQERETGEITVTIN
jgi:hypothetical protein